MRISAIFLLFLLLFSLPSFGQTGPAAKAEFDYLDVSGNVVRTTHAAKYRIRVAKGFKYLGEFHHQATYNDIGFNVSMAVFARGKDLLMIHAERHTDGSGGLDYSGLEPAKLSGLPFTQRTQCASPEDREELDSNPQIRFVRSKGFDLTIPFQLEQDFATSKDGTSEVVISYGRAVERCSDAIGAELKKEIQEAAKITEI
jgi:hypothetical protein